MVMMMMMMIMAHLLVVLVSTLTTSSWSWMMGFRVRWRLISNLAWDHLDTMTPCHHDTRAHLGISTTMLTMPGCPVCRGTSCQADTGPASSPR